MCIFIKIEEYMVERCRMSITKGKKYWNLIILFIFVVYRYSNFKDFIYNFNSLLYYVFFHISIQRNNMLWYSDAIMFLMWNIIVIFSIGTYYRHFITDNYSIMFSRGHRGRIYSFVLKKILLSSIISSMFLVLFCWCIKSQIDQFSYIYSAYLIIYITLMALLINVFSLCVDTKYVAIIFLVSMYAFMSVMPFVVDINDEKAIFSVIFKNEKSMVTALMIMLLLILAFIVIGRILVVKKEDIYSGKN